MNNIIKCFIIEIYKCSVLVDEASHTWKWVQNDKHCSGEHFNMSICPACPTVWPQCVACQWPPCSPQ